uniref:Uncharacterized protein n=1 Tax=Cacopsylla melanoneura TaxID=428564 RepID=A0A8D8ZLQ9_9HEMI
MKSLLFVLLDLNLMLILINHVTDATKIIDYDNVVENPYYRKSNLDLLIRRQCQFLQVKTSSTPAPARAEFKGKMADKLKGAFEEIGIPIKSDSDLTDRIVEGLVSFIRTINPTHPLASRNLTQIERARIENLMPLIMERMENEPDSNDYNGLE